MFESIAAFGSWLSACVQLWESGEWMPETHGTFSVLVVPTLPLSDT